MTRLAFERVCDEVRMSCRATNSKRTPGGCTFSSHAQIDSEHRARGDREKVYGCGLDRTQMMQSMYTDLNGAGVQAGGRVGCKRVAG